MSNANSHIVDALIKMKIEAFNIEHKPYQKGDTYSFAVFAGSIIAEANTPQFDFDILSWKKVEKEVKSGNLRKDIPWFFELHDASALRRQLFEIGFNEETGKWYSNPLDEM